MAKLEDKVNEILGIESIPETTQPKEFQPPVERPKGDVEVKKYADWATAELPRVRAALAASQEAALSAVDVPVLAPLEEGVLWESSSGDLSASAELRPRGRLKKGAAGINRLPLLIGGIALVVLAAVGVLAAIFMF